MSEQDATLDDLANEAEPKQQTKGQTESRFWGLTPEGWELVDPDTVYEVNPNPKPDEEPNTYIEMDALDTELPWPRYFGERNASEYSGKTFTAGDTLFARITPCTENGKAALVPEMETRVGIGSTEFAVLSPNREHILPWYLFYVAKSYPVHNYAVSRMRGSTGRQRVPFSVFRREWDVALPPPEEQRKIASVLYTVDQAIQKTEAIVSQIERVETGLFQDLFSGSHLNKETEEISSLGEVPTHWNTQPMGEVCDITMGTSPKSEYYNELGEGLPFFQANNEFGIRNPTHDRWCSNPVKTATEDDVLMTIRGTYVGQVNIADRKCCIGRGLAGISSGDHHTSEFLYHHLREREKYVKSIAIGSTFDSVSSDELNNLNIAVPRINEQKEIATTLQTIQKQIIEAETYHSQLQRLKQGLQQDLLSGEVRTHNKDIDLVDDVLQHG